MKSTFVFRPEGTRSAVDITLLVSYFIKPKETIEAASKTVDITLKPGTDEVVEVDFGTTGVTTREVLLRLQRREGGILTQHQFRLADIAGKRERVAVPLNAEIDPDAQPEPPTDATKPAFVYGRLLDRKGGKEVEDVQLIILVQTVPSGDLEPLTTVRTEAQGYFSMDYPPGTYLQAAAQVGLDLKLNPIPIKLDEEKRLVDNGDGGQTQETVLVFPRRVILVTDLREATQPTPDAESDCGCEVSKFDQKRVLEEFSFYTLVRTSEPAIKGYVIEDEDEITLADVLGSVAYFGL